jgi:NAD(P)-dependent dehydrogenase (short-subunit alcohol dehydrogenase family)
VTPPLTNRTALVTGASRGIGAATARLLAALGARVVRVARSPMPELPGALDFRSDLADLRARAEVLERIAADAGVPDIIVSNAGAFLLAPLEASSDELLREQVAINLEAPFAIARTFLPLMRARGAGRHVLVGSVSDSRAFPGNAAYSASKFGARGLHEVLVEEYRGTGVLCTLVSPGPTDTTAWDPVDPDRTEGLTRRAAMLRPHDVAEAIAWVVTRPAHVAVESLRINPGEVVRGES